MKYLISVCLCLVVASGAHALPAHYHGEISGGGDYSGSLDINFGWINPPFGMNAASEDINLWGFNGAAGDTLSFNITSNDLLTGFSLFFGEVSSLDLLYGLFNNSGDIGNAKFLTGADFWDTNQSLRDFTLAETGFYTLIVGGKDFGGYSGYEYQIDVDVQVPEPGTLLLLSSGLIGLLVLRRRRTGS